MIKVSLELTPDPKSFLLAFECNGAPDELDELYATLMSGKMIGAAWKASNKFEVLIGKIGKDDPDPAGS